MSGPTGSEIWGCHRMRRISSEIEGWEVLGVYAFGARTKRVYPRRKRREVLESTPSGEDNTTSSTEEEPRLRDERFWSVRLRTAGVHPQRKRREVLRSTPSCDSRYSSTEEETRSRDERFLESTPSGRGQKELIHGGRDERFWSLRLRATADIHRRRKMRKCCTPNNARFQKYSTSSLTHVHTIGTLSQFQIIC